MESVFCVVSDVCWFIGWSSCDLKGFGVLSDNVITVAMVTLREAFNL